MESVTSMSAATSNWGRICAYQLCVYVVRKVWIAQAALPVVCMVLVNNAALSGRTLCSSFQRVDKSSQTVCLPRNFNCTLPLRDVMVGNPFPVSTLCHLPAEMKWSTSQANAAEHLQMWNASNPLWSANANSWVYLTLPRLRQT